MEPSFTGATAPTPPKNVIAVQQLAASENVVNFLPFVVSNWGCFLLSKVNILFRDENHCDLILVFPNESDSICEIPVHAVVLHACTDFFNVEMEKQKLSMGSSNRLSMPAAINMGTMEALLKSIYTGVFSLKKDNFERVFNAAKLLKMSLVTTAMEIRLKQINSLKKRLDKSEHQAGNATMQQTKKLSSELTPKINPKVEKAEIVREQTTNKNEISTAAAAASQTDTEVETICSEPLKSQSSEAVNGVDDTTASVNNTLLPPPPVERDLSPITITTILKSRHRGEQTSAPKRPPPPPAVQEAATPPKKPRTLYSTEPVKQLTSSDVFRKYSAREVPTEGDSASIISDILKKKPDLLKGDQPLKLKLLCKSAQGHQRMLNFTVRKTSIDGKKCLQIVQGLEEPNKKKSEIVSPPGGPWDCSTCVEKDKRPLTFTSYKECREHHSTVHGHWFNPKSCDICGDTLSRRLFLAHHQLVRHGVEPPSEIGAFPKCPDCTFIAPNDEALKRHSKKHESHKLFASTVLKEALLKGAQSEGEASPSSDSSSPLEAVAADKASSSAEEAQCNQNTENNSTSLFSTNSIFTLPSETQQQLPQDQETSSSQAPPCSSSGGGFTTTSLPKFEELAAGLPPMQVQEPLQLLNLVVPTHELQDHQILFVTDEQLQNGNAAYGNANIAMGGAGACNQFSFQYPFDASNLQLFNGDMTTTQQHYIAAPAIGDQQQQHIFPDFASSVMGSEQQPLMYNHPVAAATTTAATSGQQQYQAQQFQGGFQQQGSAPGDANALQQQQFPQQ